MSSAARDLGGIPAMVQHADMSNTIPDEKVRGEEPLPWGPGGHAPETGRGACRRPSPSRASS